MPAAASVLMGPAEMQLTRIPDGPQVGGHETDIGLEAGLGGTHDVVVGQRAHGCQVADGQQRTARPELRTCGLGQRDEAVAADVLRGPEAVAGHGVDVAARKLFPRGVGDGVNDDVDMAPFPREGLECGIDLAVIGHVQRQDDA